MSKPETNFHSIENLPNPVCCLHSLLHVKHIPLQVVDMAGLKAKLEQSHMDRGSDWQVGGE